VPRGWTIIARKATPTAVYWVVLSLVAFLGISAVLKIEPTGTRLFLVVVVIAVAFSAASFLERLLRDYLRTDRQPDGEAPSISELSIIRPMSRRSCEPDQYFPLAVVRRGRWWWRDFSCLVVYQNLRLLRSNRRL
jgi:hypothetical protein